ncbi:MAG TPA: hypothetical protein VF018_12590 [Acidobacteriaceae bacterium]
MPRTASNQQTASYTLGPLAYPQAAEPLALKMTHCDKRDLDAPEGHFAIGVSILLLALAVFGWGLHSKLSLYHVRAHASETAPIAKLLSERERPTDTAQHAAVNHADLHRAPLASAVVLLPQSSENTRPARPRSETPPLASRTLAIKGPSLRRPPPFLVS